MLEGRLWKAIDVVTGAVGYAVHHHLRSYRLSVIEQIEFIQFLLSCQKVAFNPLTEQLNRITFKGQTYLVRTVVDPAGKLLQLYRPDLNNNSLLINCF